MGQANQFDPRSLAPFVPTPLEVVERMLVLGDVKSSDTLYDLGSGDGRIVITAAQRFGARAVGVELDADLAKRAQARIKELYIADRAKVVVGDVMDVDLSEASVVTLYFLSASNMKLRPKLEDDLKPGTRVVSHDFQIFSTDLKEGNSDETYHRQFCSPVLCGVVYYCAGASFKFALWRASRPGRWTPRAHGI